MLNQCQFIGNLGRDPEIRNFSNGGKVCNLRVACTEKWRGNDGERKEHTEWVSVAVFNDGLIGVCEKYLSKGSRVFVSGKMRTRKYQDQSGADRYSTEIVLQGYGGALTMLDGAQGGSDSGQSGGNYDAPAPQGSLDDDIPF